MLMPKNQNLNIERWDYRLTYAKEGRARYISHLDLMRTMQRVIKRARVPIWYTQGFNPHAYLMFPLALPLGTDSKVEILDIALTEDIPFDKVVDMLNSSMPEGLYFVSAARPVMKHTDIASAEYVIRAELDAPADSLLEKWQEFVSQEEITIEKRTKPKKGRKQGGVKLVDIKPHITVVSAQARENALMLTLRLPAGGEFNLNSSVVTDAFFAFAQTEPEQICTERTKILAVNGEEFA